MHYPATIQELCAIGRQQQADAHAAEQADRAMLAHAAEQARQAALEAFRSIVLSELSAILHPYIDWDAVKDDDWRKSIHIGIAVPDCAPLSVEFDRDSGRWEWNGSYAIRIPDHVEFDYEGDYHIHYEPRFESELPVALAIAADAYPKLLELQAEVKTLQESRRINREQAEAIATEYEKEDERQHEALLHILEADPVLRALFHVAIAYQNARGSWDAQLSSQYQEMQALERRYSDDLDLERARRDYDAEQRALGEAPAAPEPAPPVILSEAKDLPPTYKPGLSAEDMASVRAQLARRHSESHDRQPT